MAWCPRRAPSNVFGLLFSLRDLAETATLPTCGCPEARCLNPENRRLATVPNRPRNQILEDRRELIQGTRDSGVDESLPSPRVRVAGMRSSTGPMPGKPGRGLIPCSESPCKPSIRASRLTAHNISFLQIISAGVTVMIEPILLDKRDSRSVGRVGSPTAGPLPSMAGRDILHPSIGLA